MGSNFPNLSTGRIILTRRLRWSRGPSDGIGAIISSTGHDYGVYVDFLAIRIVISLHRIAKEDEPQKKETAIPGKICSLHSYIFYWPRPQIRKHVVSRRGGCRPMEPDRGMGSYDIADSRCREPLNREPSRSEICHTGHRIRRTSFCAAIYATPVALLIPFI